MAIKIRYPKDKIAETFEANIAMSGNPAAYHYYENDEIWKLIKDIIEDTTFMKICIFNNDYLSIAPVHTFSSYFLDGKRTMTNLEKNSIGRIFKFIFELLGYDSSVRTSRSNTTIGYGKVFIKTTPSE